MSKLKFSSLPELFAPKNELKKLLKEAGISEYSIFLDEETNTLFAFQKVSGDGSSQDLGQTEIVKKYQVVVKLLIM